MNRKLKVIVGMSGGVDSSVSARLLMEQGYEVEGLFMKNWDEDDGTEYCTARQDLADASAVCERLQIPLHTANFAAEYWDNVFAYFLQEFRNLRTPNPDVLCNSEIKFKVFLEYAEVLGGDLIATGHYARTRRGSSGAELHKGKDNNKDQSYFLHAVGYEAFERTLFPLGDMQKPRVRELAQRWGFDNSHKKDSTGICFIGERRFRDFLKTYLPAQPGEIVTTEGLAVGQHEGLMYYTPGQRQGLGIGGVKGYPEEPWYVVDKQVAENRLVVAQGEHPLLYSTALLASAPHWISGDPADVQRVSHCKTRYRQADQACRPVQLDEQRLRVEFDQPQRAVTPGQYVVFYQGTRCLGGAVIEEAIH